jgi:hypothetical protein
MICLQTNFIPTDPLLSYISIPAATSITRFRKSSFRRGTARGAAALVAGSAHRPMPVSAFAPAITRTATFMAR